MGNLVCCYQLILLIVIWLVLRSSSIKTAGTFEGCMGMGLGDSSLEKKMGLYKKKKFLRSKKITWKEAFQDLFKSFISFGGV